MGSDVNGAPLEDVERLDGLKLKAQASLREGNTKAYTSPRALRSFLNQQLPELSSKRPCEHELLLVDPQSYENSHANFVSTVCGECRHHFHFSSNGPSPLARKLDQNHPQHMLLACEQKSHADFAGDRARNKHDYTYASVCFICCDDQCHFTLEITASTPRVTDKDVEMFLDQDRVRENLARAREDDPDRYKDVEGDYGAQAANTMLIYLGDHLARKPDAGPLKIKKRNKRFMVSFSTDFDPLLRSLGWEEREDPDGEACWFLPEPRPRQDRTLTKTVEAHYEDARAELMLLFSASRPKPAWQQLLRVVQGHYDQYRSAPSVLDQMAESDLGLLGCLNDYGPAVFSWAAILLATTNPRKRLDYTDAALRCIGERSEAARDAIVIFQSSFDAGSTNASFDYFDTTPSMNKPADYFIDKFIALASQNPSDEEKRKALHHLEIIEGETKLDIIAYIKPDMLKFDDSAVSYHGKGGFSVQAAAQLLGVEVDWPAELIRDFVHNVDETKPRSDVALALISLADHKREEGQLKDANELQQIAEFVQGSEIDHLRPAAATTSKNDSSKPEDPLVEVAPSMDVPPGIYNIGNTCYLNSLLQYFFNVVPVRQLLKEFDSFKLELDEEHVEQRTTGGNALKFNLNEAIVARQFVETLQDLLQQLETTPYKAVHGSQRLANTALESAAELLKNKDVSIRQDTKPPPLPARPSPAPPEQAGEDTDMGNVTVKALEAQSGDSPAGSSQTLVDEPEPMLMESAAEGHANRSEPIQATTQASSSGAEAMNVASNDDDLHQGLSLEERTARIARKLDRSERKGTSQQDVGEIMGNILEHLARSIKATGTIPERSNVQTDMITDVFFTTMVNHTIDLKKDPEVNKTTEERRKEVILDRWIQAFPHPEKGVSSSLYEALDRNFGFEVLSNTRVRYSTIQSLPPILHICIQRTDNSGAKNSNPVVMPEILYMDRYMDAEEDSQLGRTRRRMWTLQEYLRELETRTRKDPEYVIKLSQQSTYFDPPPTQADLGDKFDPAGPPALNEELLRDLVPVLNKRKSSNASMASLKRQRSGDIDTPTEQSTYVEELYEDSVNLVEETNSKLAEARHEIDSAFADMKEHKYTIHAIICHLGDRSSSGHYWVWIRDYKKNTWLSYNDANVTVDARTAQELLDELNRGGNPYYIAYVRDADKEELVDVLHRTVPIAMGVPGKESVSTADGEGAAGTTSAIKPTQDENNDDVMHIETIEGIDPSRIGDVSKVRGGAGVDAKMESSIKTEVYEVNDPPPYEIL